MHCNRLDDQFKSQSERAKDFNPAQLNLQKSEILGLRTFLMKT